MIYNVGSGAGGGVMKYLNGTLTAGQTVLTISDASIVADTIISEICTDVFGVSPTDISAQVGSVTLTFEAQETNINVKVGCV